MRNRQGIYILALMGIFVIATAVYSQFFFDPEKAEAERIFGAAEPNLEQLESKLLALQIRLMETETRAAESLRRGTVSPEKAKSIRGESRRSYDRALALARKIAKKQKFQLDPDLLMPSSAIASK